MIKTLIIAFLSFLGLKGGDYIVHKVSFVLKWFLISIVFLISLKVIVPFGQWYLKSIGEIISPITKPATDRWAAARKAEEEYYKAHPEEYEKDKRGCWCKIK